MCMYYSFWEKINVLRNMNGLYILLSLFFVCNQQMSGKSLQEVLGFLKCSPLHAVICIEGVDSLLL